MPSVLLIDRAGRGHALADALIRTNKEVVVHYVPGCDAIKDRHIKSYRGCSMQDHDALLELADRFRVDLVIVANVYALYEGCADVFRRNGYPAVGPSREACKLETSKVASKLLFNKYRVPQAEFRCFADPRMAKEYVASVPFKVVVKADGLSFGNGAFVCDSRQEAYDAIDLIMVERRFGDAGNQIVIEERFFGVEFSYFGLFDGKMFVPLPMAMDYPRSGDGDTGLTCAGVGSLSPHPLESPHLCTQVERRIVEPVLNGIASEALDYRGPIYFGCILVGAEVFLLEVNVRLGDPESQALLPRIESDLYTTFQNTAKSKLSATSLKLNSTCCCAVTAYQGPTEKIVDGHVAGMHQGWPTDDYVTGHEVVGLERVDSSACAVYFGNLDVTPDGRVLTASNRPFNVVGQGISLAIARENAYRNLRLIRFNGMTYRSDIGLLSKG